MASSYEHGYQVLKDLKGRCRSLIDTCDTLHPPFVEHHAKELNKILDYIIGREDWSSLTPVTPQRMGRSDKRVSFTPSTVSSRRSLSSRYPHQATVEDVVDSGDDLVHPHNSTYYMNPDELDLSLRERRPSTAGSSGGRPQSPIRFVLRQPIDPTDLDTFIKPLDINSIEESIKSFSVIDPPLRSPISNLYTQDMTEDKTTEELRKLERDIATSSPKSNESRPRKGKTPALSDPFQFSTQSRGSSNFYSARSKHSIDSGSLQVPDGITRRPRTSTMRTSDVRRPVLGGHSFSDETSRLPRSPRYSPHESPYGSSKDYSPPRRQQESHASSSSSSFRRRDTLYGTPYSTSLPTVSEQTAKRDRAADERANKRSSWNGGDEFAFFDTESASSAQPLFRTAPSTSSSSIKADSHPGNVSTELAITATELCVGATKRLEYRCKLEDNLSGVITLFDQTATVEILPGLRYRGRITLPNYGSWIPHLRSRGDLIVHLVRKSDDPFQVEHRDIILPIEISVYESMAGFKRTIATVCGKKERYITEKCTPHGKELIMKGFGLPKFEGKGKKPGKRGDMVLKVEVVWPSGELDSSRKALLKQALGESGYRSPQRRY
jgi:hypothetical protein